MLVHVRVRAHMCVCSSIFAEVMSVTQFVCEFPVLASLCDVCVLIQYDIIVISQRCVFLRLKNRITLSYSKGQYRSPSQATFLNINPPPNGFTNPTQN